MHTHVCIHTHTVEEGCTKTTVLLGMHSDTLISNLAGTKAEWDGASAVSKTPK